MNNAQIQAEPALDPPPHSTERGICVLLVEDDDADAYLIERALSTNPNIAGIIRATDGVEALHLVNIGAVDPDIALIDLQMPRKSGFHLLVDFASRRQPCFPMVVLTSSTAPTDAMRSRLRGATHVLTKPDSVEDLEAILSAAITSAWTGVTLPGGGKRSSKRRLAFDNSAPRPKGRRTQAYN